MRIIRNKECYKKITGGTKDINASIVPYFCHSKYFQHQFCLGVQRWVLHFFRAIYTETTFIYQLFWGHYCKDLNDLLAS